MMEMLTIIGLILFSGTCLFVGVRLLLLARRTRDLPELLIGVSLVMGGFVSHVLNISFRSSVFDGWAGGLLGIVGRLAYVAAALCLSLLAWRVFRPDRPWAGVLVGALVTINLLFVIRPYLIGDLPQGDLIRHPMYWITTVAQVVPWLWVGLESFHLHRMLKRQAKLGLSKDPSLAQRMLLWTVGLGAIVLLSVVLEVSSVAATLRTAYLPLAPFIIVLGLVCAISFGLAFFPPAALLRRFEAAEERSG